MKLFARTAAILVLSGLCSAARAEALHVEAVMSPKESMQLDFQDGSKHFFLMVRREGQASGTGLLKDAKVVEYGVHDIVPGQGGDPRGYLVLTRPDGAMAYVKWQVRAVFVPGADGKPVLLDNGFWEIVGATGTLTGLSGAGILHIKPVSPTDRRYILDGDLVQKAP
jgi:hypothetical protein